MSAKTLANLINERTGGHKVSMGLILGSGLSGLVDAVQNPISIPFADLEGFPQVGVSGHNPNLVIGTIEGVDIAVFGGRAHYYEHGQADIMRLPLETIKELGATSVFVANSAGSLRKDIAPGDLMLITDHINLSGANPLIGEADEKRFVDMVDAYDRELRQALLNGANARNIKLSQGVYAWFSGPNFETPAEVRMAARLGADAVGMSTVPEVILARFLGLKAVGVSNITNMGAGLSEGGLSHEQTKQVAGEGAEKFEALLCSFLRQLS